MTYSKEVIKAAEELIEKHGGGKESKDYPELHRVGIAGSNMAKAANRQALEAAIVSCKFATLMIGDNNDIVSVNGMEYDFIDTIKAYLEELL